MKKCKKLLGFLLTILLLTCLFSTTALAAGTGDVELGLSRSTVKRALDDLCKAGLLQKDPRWRENGSYTSNLYRLL